MREGHDKEQHGENPRENVCKIISKTKALKTMKEHRLKTKAGLMDREFTEENKEILKD